MKNYNLHHVAFLLFLFVSGYPSFAQEMNYKDKIFKTTQEKSEFVLYLAKNYCSNASAILAYQKKPKGYTHYIGGSTHSNVLYSFNTLIHESCHHANSEIGEFETGISYEGIFVTPEIQIRIPLKSVYKSSELAGIVPKERQDSIFRFITYIKGTTDSGVKIPFLRSVNEGIYGLLNEFSAYHQGLRAHLELYPYFQSFLTDDDYKEMIKYIQDCSSDVFAYYEFRLFIAWYLKYAQEKHPEVYKDCIENKNLKVAFTLVDLEYHKTMDKYYRTRAAVVEKINQSGKTKATITTDGSVSIPDGTGSRSWGGPEEDNNYLMSLLTPEYQAMLDLMLIRGLTLSNYKDYLEK